MEIDETNKIILRLLKDNGRMSFTELGEQLGLSRVAVKKRVAKLEEQGIIRGYKAVIHREDAIKMYMEIITVDEEADELIDYLHRTGYVTELYIMTGKNRIHATAVAPEVSELKYLTKMLQKTFPDKIKRMECHAVKEVLRDEREGVEYDRVKQRNNERDESVS